MLEALIEHHQTELKKAQSVLDAEEQYFSDQIRASASLLAAKHRSLLAILSQAAQEMDGTYPKWLHKKRGSTYHEIGHARAQTEDVIQDNDILILYRGEDGCWFVRKTAEFHDGRFERLTEGG